MQLLRHEHDFHEPLGLLSDCHRRIERFLAILHKVALDAPEGPLPKLYREGLAGALDYFAQAAPKHTADEEESLFPRIADHQQAARVIAELEEDHQACDPLHRIVEELGRRWLLEEGLESEARAEFRRAVEALQGIYTAHIKREDEELFPLAATLLDEESLREVGVEMAARRGLDRAL